VACFAISPDDCHGIFPANTDGLAQHPLTKYRDSADRRWIYRLKSQFTWTPRHTPLDIALELKILAPPLQ
ncbi:MAG: hypothetical protein AAB327_02250, partial [Actinomycetota bacterium]